MPLEFLSDEQASAYVRFRGEFTRAELERPFLLEDVDRESVTSKRREHNKLGFAMQLVTVRYLGTFLEDRWMCRLYWWTTLPSSSMPPSVQLSYRQHGPRAVGIGSEDDDHVLGIGDPDVGQVVCTGGVAPYGGVASCGRVGDGVRIVIEHDRLVVFRRCRGIQLGTGVSCGFPEAQQHHHGGSPRHHVPDGVSVAPEISRAYRATGVGTERAAAPGW
ncbi:protein of unknown function [Actinopolyspora mzabensis]|uniref:DUF4158 domain-containing protein n=1 Tax=Actinopolyspora mzabensis TaxID=995066 RepID=A0A1G8Y0P8_ACTMZ|nr:DUF4158 domain-containing protein [Actinopolyspora mzabensis]SDJ96419.1 protein of unknown function [Actinopolyspora mzabensis]